jgi:nitroreductase
MIKEAKTIYPVHDLIKKRFSARSFSDAEIKPDEIDTILEAASWAFSAMNYQPWRYIYVHKSDEENFQKFADCLNGGNSPWAKNAPVLMFCLVKKKYDDGNVNSAAYHDVGAANATMLLQAASMEIYGHVMGGFSKSKSVELLQIDTEEYDPFLMIALGYLDSPETLKEPFRTREVTPRSRKGLKEFSEEFHKENEVVSVG